MFVFVGVEIIFLVVLGTVSPLRTKALNISEHFSETGQKEIVQIFRCTCSDESKFVIAMYCYKGVLLLFGVFIAWQTKIKTKKLQLKGHTKDIAIYNIASISVIGVICFNALKNANNLDAEYAVVALCIIIGTTTTLLLVFYEKLWRFMVSALCVCTSVFIFVCFLQSVKKHDLFFCIKELKYHCMLLLSLGRHRNHQILPHK